jgi:predicted metalloprotease with PDZ domain
MPGNHDNPRLGTNDKILEINGRLTDEYLNDTTNTSPNLELYVFRPGNYIVIKREPKQELGMNLKFDGESMIVTSVNPNSPAELAKLQKGDVIVSMNETLIPILPNNGTELELLVKKGR